MSDTPAVSVIIPVYNMENYIAQCLDSVINQTLREIEIICVDDGSTDGTPEILRNFAAKDDRIHIITQDNRGAGAARNRGLETARGEALSFLDADDFFEPEMLETAFRKMKETEAQLVVIDSDQYNDDTGEYEPGRGIVWDRVPPYEPFHRRAVLANTFHVFIGWPWDKLFDAGFVRDNALTFQELRTSNDMYFVFSAVVLSDRIAVSDRKLVHHRRNVRSSLSNTREESWSCFYEALLKIRETLLDHGLYYELEQDYINYCLHACLWNLDTLKGDARTALYQMLKTEGFEKLGVLGREQIYFDNRQNYDKLIRICQTSPEEYFQNEKQKQAKEE